MTKDDGRTHVYTDGGARPNPGAGGWGAVLLRPGREPEELSGGEPRTTNNRMELTAAIRALEALDEGEGAVVHTDSAYVRNGITKWLPGWVARGWKRKGGAVENEDLWRRLASLDADREVTWKWVKGHSGNRWNERADTLATEGRKPYRQGGGEAAAVEVADGTWEVYLRISCVRGRGGWAAAVRRAGEEGSEKMVHGRARGTTPNRLDLEAAAELLEGLPEGAEAVVFTGSDYLRHGASRWIHGWRRGGWTTKAGKPVANRDLWERLQAAMDRLSEVRWPAPGDDEGEALDRLETAAREARTEG